MTVNVYGRDVTCDDCGSDNTVERTRYQYLDYGGETEYQAAVCLTCGWEVPL